MFQELQDCGDDILFLVIEAAGRPNSSKHGAEAIVRASVIRPLAEEKGDNGFVAPITCLE